MIVWTAALTAPAFTHSDSDSGCAFSHAAAASDAAEAARTLALAYAAPAGSEVTITIDGRPATCATLAAALTGQPDPTPVLDAADALDERISA
ncbi:hypothetical protein [Rhodococcus artemisiae]|uniref:Uncharacterized protein n=1 Tax=Rhodococcus artemisiae TaxID=714159 RepID=A0ABU7LJF7_9NOCA|nr:hypothetical protein [Rhodococcus artemisiae]MEE2061696.1 hypothetical protein [Rhodococcus artemisiae]